MNYIKKEFGKKFKELREDIGSSQLELCDDIISTSSLSRFEKGEQDITFTVAIHLLNKLNVRLDEFYFHVENVSQSVGEELREIGSAYRMKDVDKLKKLSKYYHQQQYVTFRNVHYRIICEGYIADIKGKEISEENITIIKDYLFKVKDWRYYEVTLFGNVFHILQIETIDLLARTALKKVLRYKNMSKHKGEYASLSLNIAGHFIDKAYFSGAEYQLVRIKKYLSENPEYIYSQIRLTFTEGYFYIKSKRDVQKGETMMLKAIKQMKEFHLETEAKRHEEFFTFIQSQ